MPVKPLTQFEGHLDTDFAHKPASEIKREIADEHQAQNSQRRFSQTHVADRDPVDPHFEENRHECFKQPPRIDQRHAAPKAPAIAVYQGHKPP